MDSNVNWVKERFDCSVAHAFGLLCQRIKSDIEEWDRLKQEKRSVTISLTEDGDVAAITTTVASSRTQGNYLLENVGNHFKFYRQPPRGERIFTPKLDENSICKLEHDGKLLEFWQASKVILESLLFP